MASRIDLQRRVEAILHHLRSGLTEEDRRNGWTERGRQAMVAFFERMLRDIHSGESLMPLEYRTILRGLDHWGVMDGSLLDQAAEISNEVAALVGESA